MLSVDDGLAFICLTGLKKQRRTAARESERLETKHSAQLQRAWAKTTKRDGHKPVCGFKLGDASRSARRIQECDEVVMQHQHPLARNLVDHVHGRAGRLSRSARAHLSKIHHIRFARTQTDTHTRVRHHHERTHPHFAGRTWRWSRRWTWRWTSRRHGHVHLCALLWRLAGRLAGRLSGRWTRLCSW